MVLCIVSCRDQQDEGNLYQIPISELVAFKALLQDDLDVAFSKDDIFSDGNIFENDDKIQLRKLHFLSGSDKKLSEFKIESAQGLLSRLPSRKSLEQLFNNELNKMTLGDKAKNRKSYSNLVSYFYVSAVWLRVSILEGSAQWERDLEVMLRIYSKIIEIESWEGRYQFFFNETPILIGGVLIAWREGKVFSGQFLENNLAFDLRVSEIFLKYLAGSLLSQFESSPFLQKDSDIFSEEIFSQKLQEMADISCLMDTSLQLNDHDLFTEIIHQEDNKGQCPALDENLRFQYQYCYYLKSLVRVSLAQIRASNNFRKFEFGVLNDDEKILEKEVRGEVVFYLRGLNGIDDGGKEGLDFESKDWRLE